MGFDGIVSTSIMFIAVVMMVTGVVAVMKTNVDESISSTTVKQQFYANQIKSAISIEHAYYENGNVVIFVKNIGNSPLKPSLMSVYTGNNHARLNDTNAQILPETDTRNVGVFDKEEVLRIETPVALESNHQYTLKIFTQYDTSAVKTLTT